MEEKEPEAKDVDKMIEIYKEKPTYRIAVQENRSIHLVPLKDLVELEECKNIEKGLSKEEIRYRKNFNREEYSCNFLNDDETPDIELGIKLLNVMDKEVDLRTEQYLTNGPNIKIVLNGVKNGAVQAVLHCMIVSRSLGSHIL
jgi:hypothetical protein